MPMPLSLLRKVQASEPAAAWASLLGHVWGVCSAPLDEIEKAPSEVAKRDGEVGAADLFLATAGWDLWNSFATVAPRTTEALVSWWNECPTGRAVLILDALSLREVPWLLEGAAQREYTVHQARPMCSELPADTTPFAKALGFPSRGSLQNNGATTLGRLKGATTETTNLPWADCSALINSSRDWLLWHHWPDERLHSLSGPGQGLAALSRDAAEKLTSDAFWEMVHRLTTGRRLIITGDHGYAASGHFPDTVDSSQAKYLRERFKSGRWAALSNIEHPSLEAWVPPLDLQLKTAPAADIAFVLGRRKWKSQGGYPTLTHGGLTLLEVAVPFIELSRTGGV
jgi:hypothetical protein